MQSFTGDVYKRQLSDGAQSVTPDEFRRIASHVEEVAGVFGKTLSRRDDQE